jgi:hypothetical protein
VHRAKSAGAGPVASHAEVLDANLDKTPQPLEFWAHKSGVKGCRAPLEAHAPACQGGFELAGQVRSIPAVSLLILFIRCDKGIIRDHNDIWSDTAMEVYTALYRLVGWARDPSNDSRTRFSPTIGALW